LRADNPLFNARSVDTMPLLSYSEGIGNLLYNLNLARKLMGGKDQKIVDAMPCFKTWERRIRT
jgi:hypothetical protein